MCLIPEKKKKLLGTVKGSCQDKDRSRAKDDFKMEA